MRSVLMFAMIALPIFINAQIKATTEGGKEVLLFENGTWEYVTQETVRAIETKAVEIDVNLTKESELGDLYYAESKKLAKFFGPVKGKIKGRAKCMIAEGKPKVFFQWEFSLLDSYRYFGQMKSGRVVVLKTKNNTPIELVLNEDIDTEYMEKYNFSIMRGACTLNDEQFKLLMNSPVSEVEVHWKKGAETYKIDDGYFFSKAFQELLK